jgi:hypothetical protein
MVRDPFADDFEQKMKEKTLENMILKSDTEGGQSKRLMTRDVKTQKEQQLETVKHESKENREQMLCT